MQVFLTILVLVILALLATSRRLYTLRRRRPVIVLIAGGWVAMGAGAALGPAGVALISEDAVLPMTPLIMMGMGWIGLMVGLQLRREVLAALPRSVRTLAASDAVMSILIFGGIGLAGSLLWLEHTGPGWLVGPVALIACASVGWSMETRSLRVRDDPGSQRLELLIRASAALAGVLAVAAFGVAASMGTRWNDGSMRLSLPQGAIRVGVCLGMALAASYLIREGLRLAGRSRDNQLVVFLGVVALVAGVASQFGVPTIFAAMLVGVMIANMQGVDLRRFERFILKAEHVIAAMFALLAGVLMDVRIGAPELILALAIAAARLMFKPAHFRWWARRAERTGLSGDGVSLPTDSAMYVGPVRQSPLAVALAVSLVLMEDRSTLSARLLTVIAIAGFLSDLIPLSASIARHGLRRRSQAPPDSEATPETEADPEAETATDKEATP